MFALVLATAAGTSVVRGDECRAFGRDYVDFITNGSVDGKHLVIKYNKKKRGYELHDWLSLHGTWIPVGNYVPPIHDKAGIPNGATLQRACVLQKGAVFTIGGFQIAVTRCPPVRKRYAAKYILAPSTTATLQEDKDVVDEIEEDEESLLVLNCAATHFPFVQQTFRISYGRGGIYVSIGKGEQARLKVPATHPNAQHVADIHCRILSLMGCFWLIDGDATSRSPCGTYVRLHGVYTVTRSTPPFCMYLGTEAVYVSSTE